MQCGYQLPSINYVYMNIQDLIFLILNIKNNFNYKLDFKL